MTTENKDTTKRNPTVLIGGILLVGVALALVLFGNSLFGNSVDETATGETETVLEQVPSFDEVEPAEAELPSGSGPLAVGDVAHDFSLKDLDGTVYTLSELRGRPVVVNFWATWCAPCRVEMPELQAAFEQYQDKGLVILAVDQEEPADVVSQFFFDELGLTFTPLLDTEGDVAELYGVFNFPSTFFINPEGQVTVIHRGPMVQSQIEGYLADTIPDFEAN